MEWSSGGRWRSSRPFRALNSLPEAAAMRLSMMRSFRAIARAAFCLERVETEYHLNVSDIAKRPAQLMLLGFRRLRQPLAKRALVVAASWAPAHSLSRIQTDGHLMLAVAIARTTPDRESETQRIASANVMARQADATPCPCRRRRTKNSWPRISCAGKTVRCRAGRLPCLEKPPELSSP